LPLNDPSKVIKGSEFTTEFTAIQTAFGLAAPAASPTFTGTVTIASVDINGGAIDGTTIGGTTPAAGTFSSLTATTVDINGGTIDGVTIGGSSAGAITGTTGQFNTSLNVDGTVTADGLTVDGGGSNVTVSFAPSSTFSTTVDFTNASSAFQIVSFGSGSASADNFRIRDDGASRLNIAGNGDISFYEDTGTTAKFFWDASAEALGIGTTSLAAALSPANPGIHIQSSSGPYAVIQTTADGSLLYKVDEGNTGASSIHRFDVDGDEAMRIDSSGRVGIGTSSPATALSFPIGSSTVVGQTASTDHVVGNVGSLGFGITDGGGGASGVFVHNTHDGTFSSQDIRFLTAKGGVSLATERLRIDSSGNLLVGTTTASAKLTVEGSGSAAQMVRGFATNASYTGQVIQSLASRNTTNESYEFLRCSVNGVADRLKIYDNGNVENTNNSYGSLSDIKLKENVVDASAQWDDIKGLRFRKYNFKEETGQSTHTQMGLIAQEAELVCPGIVKETTDRDQEGNDLGTTTKSIQYSLVYVKAVKALQEAMARIETLEAEVAALKGA
jgi:hypothetical protein